MVVDEVVQLADIVPSVLDWTGARSQSELRGRPLPAAPVPSRPERPIIADYEDPEFGPIRDESELAQRLRSLLQRMRRRCSADKRVFGDMQALILGRFKLIAFAQYPHELYDLSRDPGEQRDLAATQPQVVAALAERLAMEARRTRQFGPPSAVTPAPEVLRQLEALGYLDTDSAAPKTSSTPAVR
jgi:arylsulfatase A-like enzyme